MLHTLITDEVHAGPIAVGSEPLFQPRAVLSIGSPESADPVWFREVTVPKLRILFDDVERPHMWYIPPSAQDMQVILAFLQQNHGVPMLIHCAAGISRSSACGYLRLRMTQRCQPGPRLARQVSLARDLGLREPFPIRPNPRMVWLGLNIISDAQWRAGQRPAPNHWPEFVELFGPVSEPPFDP